jgi:hypothetical protein
VKAEMKGIGCMKAPSFPEKVFSVISLEEALDRHPCKHCGRHYNDHANMSEEEMEDARKQGCIVDVCEARRRWTFDGTEEGESREDTTYWCVIIPLPDDPCDVDYLKEIST